MILGIKIPKIATALQNDNGFFVNVNLVWEIYKIEAANDRNSVICKEAFRALRNQMIANIHVMGDNRGKAPSILVVWQQEEF